MIKQIANRYNMVIARKSQERVEPITEDQFIAALEKASTTSNILLMSTELKSYEPSSFTRMSADTKWLNQLSTQPKACLMMDTVSTTYLLTTDY